MSQPRKIVTADQFNRAIKLCSRVKGATGREIGEVLRKPGSDAASMLKTHLKGNPTLEFTSENMTEDVRKKLGLRKGQHKIYYVRDKAQVSTVEPSNVAPSQVGEEGIKGTVVERLTGETDQEVAEHALSPNPEEPSPETVASTTPGPETSEAGTDQPPATTVDDAVEVDGNKPEEEK